MELWRRSTIVAIGFFEALIFSGCLFGWPSLLYVMQKEGVYSHLCSYTYAPTFGNQRYESLNGTHSSGELNKVIEQEEEKDLLASTVMEFTGTTTSSPEIREFNVEEVQIRKREFVDCMEISAKEMNKIYTVAAVAFGLTAIFIGFSLDYWGLWVTRFVGSMMTAGGFLTLAFVSKEKPWLLWVSLNLIALGSNQLRLSCFQFANLWPRHRTTILIAYSSAYSISTVLFLLVQYAYEASVSLRTIGISLTLLSLLTLPVTWIMPRNRIDNHVEATNEENESLKKTKEHELADCGDSTTIILNDSKEKTNSDELNEYNEEKVKVYRTTTTEAISLKVSLFTLSAALHTLWHFINFFLVLFYSATFNLWAYKITDSADRVAVYNQYSGLCALIAPIFIPLAGFVTDWQIKKASRLEDNVEKKALTMQAPAYTMAVATFFLLATLICKMFVTEAAIFSSMVLIAISRPFVVGSCTSYIRIRFHPSHFNRLNGIFTTIVSILCLLQHPLVSWMYSSDKSFVQAHWLLLAILVLSLSSPFHMLIKSWARRYARNQLKYSTDI